MNSIMAIPNSMIIKQAFIELQQINEKTLEYGLKLSDKDITAIIERRTEVLKGNGRVEFGGGIITKIISNFCDSPYILQHNYVEIIDDLIETFYYYKNETMEEISDEELINLMKEYFDNRCQGDIELLRYKYLDKIAHNIKYGMVDYLDVDEDIERYEKGDEEE
ncbi:DUF6323 family protein [Clostridium sp. CX1]|uniref:DUF6323 family protein n=1 Tax=Clostridium sp. CX1 TaxID=2978346 RepID=UPI0021C0A89F|nr:DUF6323 family protein [Clostridium sp. CX1]MCT8977712.1 DUF6323 family protein [Clostridium sp. CX1]